MKRTITLALTCTLLLSLTACGSKAERSQYRDAVELYESGKYTSALKLFEEIPDYKDADDYISDCRYYAAMQTLSPDSTLEDGYSGNVAACTADNASAYAQAVELLKSLDGYRDSDRMLRAAQKVLEAYQAEHRIQTIIEAVEGNFTGYFDRCEYDGVNFNVYFSDSYPITFEVLKRGQTEATVADSWSQVRGMFTDVIFSYLPECTINLIDKNGDTVGTYLKGGSGGELTILFDIATKPY